MSILAKQPTVLIVGPDPEKGYIGGVASHMGILIALTAFRNASVYDPGSLNTSGRFTLRPLRILFNCFLMGKTQQKYGHVFINTSIYPSAFIKLFIILMTLKKNRGGKIRIFFHGGGFENMVFLKNHFIGFMVSRILNKADSIHFLSKEQGRGFEKVFPEISWKLFCNYLPHNQIVPRKKTTKNVLLFVGRIVREKGVFEILKAVERLGGSNRVKDIELVFAGEGPDLDLLKSASLVCPFPTKILGRLEDRKVLDELYASATMLLLPSYKEGMPYVVLEAIRAGLPVITTPTGALPDMILDGINGFIVPPQKIAPLALAIQKILDDPHLKEKMIRNNFNLFRSCFSKNAAQTYYSHLFTRKKI